MKFRFYALKLVVLCIFVFVLQLIFSGFTELFVLTDAVWNLEIWRFISSIFLHGSGGHLLYNMFALALFGSIVEKVVGGKRFMLIFFGSGIFANLISVNFYSSSLGASGAIFGVLGALVILRPFMVVWAFGMPMPMFIAGILWAAGDVIGIFVPSNVANVAHLSGMAFGILFGVWFRILKKRKPNSSISFSIPEHHIRSWENRHLGV